MRTGNVTGASIGTKGGSTTQTVILEVEFSDGDIQPVEWVPSPGEDSMPQTGSRVIVHARASGYLVASGGNDGATPVSTAGGKEIYSCDADFNKMARFQLMPDGKVNLIAPAGFYVTGDVIIDGDTDMDGTLTVSGVIKSLVDIIADYAVTAITLLTHFAQGNLGFPTGTPIQTGGGTTPAVPPTTDANGDVITGAGTTSLDNHTHAQGNDSNGDSEVETDAPS